MTNEEKANEICKKHFFDSNHYDCCMEMAEWKEQQMIDKACEYILNHFTYDYLLLDVETYIRFFKREMQGE